MKASLHLSVVRQLLVTFARSIVGWTEPNEEYVKLVAPWEYVNARQQANAIAKLSGCGLVLFAEYQAVLDLPEKPRYVIGQAVQDVYKLAHTAGAAVMNPKRWPQPGDGVMLGAHGVSPEHVGMCVSTPSAPDKGGKYLAIERVDGGQRDDHGHETIKDLWRPFEYDATGHMVEVGTGRPVIAIFDADTMAAHYGLRPQD